MREAAVDDPELLRATELGRQAIATRKRLGEDFKPFGEKTCLKRRRLLAQSGMQALAAVDDGAALTTALTKSVSDALAGGAQLSSCMTLARRLVRKAKLAQANREKETLDKLRRWTESTGEEQVQRLRETLPRLPPADVLHIIPEASEHGVVCNVEPAVLDTATHIATWASQNSLRSNVAAAVDAQSAKCSETLRDASCPQIDAKKAPPRCKPFGCCVCKYRGQPLLWRLRNNLYKGVKTLLPTSTPKNKLLLKAGFVVLQLSTSGGEPGSVACTTERASSSQDVFWHVCLQYLSPYRPTFHALTVDTAGVMRDVKRCKQLSMKARVSVSNDTNQNRGMIPGQRYWLK